MSLANNTSRNIDSLVTMLRAACEDAGMNSTLEKLLSQPEATRKFVVRELLAHFHEKGAPQELIDAFIPLLDDDVADTAWRVIFQCHKKL
jgi:hypothetical protein